METAIRNGWHFEESPLGRVLIAPSPEGQPLFYSTRDLPGSLDEKITDAIRDFVSARFGLETALSTCTQIHGTSVVRTANGNGGWSEQKSCDALWSAAHNVSLGIKVADCLPVTLLDPSNSIIANIHAGWRGTSQRIVDRVIDILTAASPFQPSSALAFLGPSIRSCCFEVGEEVVARMAERWSDVDGYTDRSRGERPYLDIPRMTADALRARGIDSVLDSGLCTRCPGSPFHSWRRDSPGAGRNLAIAAQ